MPIVNSVYKGKKLFASEFFCPHCFVIQPYHLKPMSKEIAFHPIFILETKEPPHVVECQICKNAFDPEVLARNIQGICKLACSAKDQLEKGTSPGYLKLQLMSDGLKEMLADNLIALAQQ